MRCRCCNAELRSSEIIWYPKQHRHEDLCLRCRNEIYREFLAMGWKPSKYMTGEAIDDEDKL